MKKQIRILAVLFGFTGVGLLLATFIELEQTRQLVVRLVFLVPGIILMMFGIYTFLRDKRNE